MKYLYIIFTILILTSCDLLKSEDETFQCEKNATITSGTEDICTTAVIRRYVHDATSANMNIAFVGGINIELNIHPINGKIETKTYHYPSDVDLWFPAINKGKSGTLTVTTFDTVNNLISGTFNFEAEGASNYQAYDFHSEGFFNKVRF
jgi:hypothetical protein